MKPGIFSALAIFVIKKSLLGVIADAGIETAAFTKKNVNEPHKNMNSKFILTFQILPGKYLRLLKFFLINLWL